LPESRATPAEARAPGGCGIASAGPQHIARAMDQLIHHPIELDRAGQAARGRIARTSCHSAPTAGASSSPMAIRSSMHAGPEPGTLQRPTHGLRRGTPPDARPQRHLSRPPVGARPGARSVRRAAPQPGGSLRGERLTASQGPSANGTSGHGSPRRFGESDMAQGPWRPPAFSQAGERGPYRHGAGSSVRFAPMSSAHRP